MYLSVFFFILVNFLLYGLIGIEIFIYIFSYDNEGCRYFVDYFVDFRMY